MNIVLAIAIWIGVSAICAPLIGSFLFAMHIDGSVSLIEQRPSPAAQRYFARRSLSTWSRRALPPSRVS